MTNQTITPPPRYRYGTLTIENLVATFQSTLAVRRDAMLMELAELERQLGYSNNGNPATSELRAWWRQHQGICPHCGERIVKQT